MNNTSPANTSPVEVKTPELRSVYFSFHFRGTDNGVPKEGFDSRVVQLPADMRLTNADDIKSVADAIAQTEFKEGRKYANLEITVMSLISLPV